MRKLKKAIILILSFVLLMNSAYAVSIGVSPGRVNLQNILIGGYAERTVTISTNSDQDIVAHFEVKGDIADWLRFEPNTTAFTISKSKPYKLKIIAEPPPDTRNDSYSGSITFITDRFGDLSGRAGGLVRAAVTLVVDLGVTNKEISECRAGAFGFKDIETGYPLELSVVVTNNGNVRIKPTVSIDVWDQFQENLLMSKKLVFEEIFPTTEKTVFKTIDSGLDVGQYWANVAIDECGAGDLLTFSVVEKGGIADKGALSQITNKVWAYVGETVQITANFQNTGERVVYAKFKGDIKLDDKIVKTIETEEIEVPGSETTDFNVYFTPEKPGRYVVSGRVVYNRKLTFEKSSILNVNPPEAAEGSNNTLYNALIPLFIYVIILVTLFFVVRKIIKERRNKKPF